MDINIKNTLNDYFIKHYSNIYDSKPEIKAIEDSNYYYVTHPESNIICLIPLN